MVSRTNLITKRHMQNEIYNDLETFRNKWKLKLLQKPTKTENNTTTNNSSNNYSKIKSLHNTHLVPPQWDILSTTSDKKTNSDNSISINVIPSISIEDQLREVRLEKNAQFNEYQRIQYTRKRKSWKKNLILTP